MWSERVYLPNAPKLNKKKKTINYKETFSFDKNISEDTQKCHNYKAQHPTTQMHQKWNEEQTTTQQTPHTEQRKEWIPLGANKLV